MADKRILAKNSEAELIEKKSKFIAYCRNVSSEEEAQDFISEIKKKNWNATHNVYAYQIGENGEIQRSSDDGEPSGTAGRPVLEAIKGAAVSDTAVVVTRYFGGILLGTGGLVRAYGKSAQMALEEGGVVRLTEADTICFFMDYDVLGKAENFLIREGYTIDHIEYQNSAVIYCITEKAKTESLLLKIKENFPQSIQFVVLEEKRWIRVPLV